MSKLKLNDYIKELIDYTNQGCHVFSGMMYSDRVISYLETILSKMEALELEQCEWIPVSERLPECEVEVLILTEKNTITTAMYEDGKMTEDESLWNWTDIDLIYDENTDESYLPEGWWEYRHFNPDETYNNAVDEKVIAWQPLPQPYKEAKNE